MNFNIDSGISNNEFDIISQITNYNNDVTSVYKIQQFSKETMLRIYRFFHETNELNSATRERNDKVFGGGISIILNPSESMTSKQSDMIYLKSTGIEPFLRNALLYRDLYGFVAVVYRNNTPQDDDYFDSDGDNEYDFDDDGDDNVPNKPIEDQYINENDINISDVQDQFDEDIISIQNENLSLFIPPIESGIYLSLFNKRTLRVKIKFIPDHYFKNFKINQLIGGYFDKFITVYTWKEKTPYIVNAEISTFVSNLIPEKIILDERSINARTNNYFLSKPVFISTKALEMLETGRETERDLFGDGALNQVNDLNNMDSIYYRNVEAAKKLELKRIGIETSENNFDKFEIPIEFQDLNDSRKITFITANNGEQNTRQVALNSLTSEFQNIKREFKELVYSVVGVPLKSTNKFKDNAELYNKQFEATTLNARSDLIDFSDRVFKLIYEKRFLGIMHKMQKETDDKLDNKKVAIFFNLNPFQKIPTLVDIEIAFEMNALTNDETGLLIRKVLGAQTEEYKKTKIKKRVITKNKPEDISSKKQKPEEIEKDEKKENIESESESESEKKKENSENENENESENENKSKIKTKDKIKKRKSLRYRKKKN